MACGLVLCICVFAVALFTLKRRPSPPHWHHGPRSRCPRPSAGSCWASASARCSRKLRARRLAGPGLAAGRGDGAAAVDLCVDVGARRCRRFLKSWGRRRACTPLFMTNMLGITLIVTTLIAGETALSLIFDARWRDFPFAALTMAVVPFWTLAFLNGSEIRRTAARGSRVRRDVRDVGGLRRLQRRVRELAGAVDRRGVCPARQCAMAGASARHGLS